MNRMPVLVHIGMHKTGTSFLQRQVFPQLENVLYSRNFNLRDYYKQEGEAIVISDELLSGNPFIEDTFGDFRIKVHAISTLFPSAVILVCFRDPVEYIISLYKQFLHQGGAICFDDFFNLENTGILKIEDLNYFERLEILNDNFKRVLGYKFETFKRNPGLIYQEIGKILGVDVSYSGNSKSHGNVSIKTVWQVKSLIMLNKFFGFTYKRSFYRRNNLTPRDLIQKKLAFVGGKKWDIRRELKIELQMFFREDWAKIARELL